MRRPGRKVVRTLSGLACLVTLVSPAAANRELRTTFTLYAQQDGRVMRFDPKKDETVPIPPGFPWSCITTNTGDKGVFAAGFYCFQGAVGAARPVFLVRPNCARDRPDSGLSVVELGPSLEAFAAGGGRPLKLMAGCETR